MKRRRRLNEEGEEPPAAKKRKSGWSFSQKSTSLLPGVGTVTTATEQMPSGVLMSDYSRCNPHCCWPEGRSFC